MRPELKKEIERLQAVLAAHGKDFLPVEPANPACLAQLERETGIVLDPDVRDFFTYSNGSGGEIWAVVETDRPVPVVFPLVEEAHEHWALFAPYDDSVYEEWNVPDGDERDGRIQPAYVRHRLWFPVAECDGYCLSVFYDADPTADGRPGQIIAHQCDPDALHYVAGSFLEFFRRSNDLLEARGQEILFPEDPALTLAEETADAAELREELKKVLAHVREEEARDGRGPSLDETATLFGYTDASSFLFGHKEGLRIAMEVAVLNNEPEVVSCLIAQGVEVDMRDEFGDTPLMTAAGCGHAELVRVLLGLGADVRARNEEGETALDKAARRRHPEIVRMLEEFTRARVNSETAVAS